MGLGLLLLGESVETFLDWLRSATLGAFFGLISAWFWCLGSTALAILKFKKNVPNWLILLVGGDPKTRSIRRGFMPVANIDLVPKAISVTSLIALILLPQIAILNDNPSPSVSTILLIESSFTLFSIIIWVSVVAGTEKVLKKSSRP